ncbi:MAG: hypothetical protein F6J96_01990 [Symploca sp. SIO1C2]|nr:hypothetical protein [Symploca sp. SIO1C2]NER50784.1 hypothetical protein [Symploca sp. SIO1A3]
MKLQLIDESQFKQFKGIRRIIVHDHARKFASLDLDNLETFGLSWRSDFIEPIIMLSSGHSTVWVGVDQQLVALDLKRSKISVALPLSSNIVQILTSASLTIVLTELELLLFNSDCSIRSMKGLPDIGSEILLQDTNLIVYLLEGDSLILDIETGMFKEPAIASSF